MPGFYCIFNDCKLYAGGGGRLRDRSLALFDAGHMFSDAVSLAMTLFAFVMGKKAGQLVQNILHRRLEILIALINGGRY